MRTELGTFICIEGIDGSGKTTQSRLLVKNLQKRGFDAVYTTEPSRGVVGRFIRRTILQREKRAPIRIEALLFAADRVDHVEREIKPALKMGKVVVSDRYVYSSLAYQGATGLDLEWIKEINRWAVQPDLGIFIDVPPEIVFERINRKKTIMETIENQRKVREAYMKFVREGQLVTINGNKPVNEVGNDILGVVLEYLGEKRKLYKTV